MELQYEFLIAVSVLVSVIIILLIVTLALLFRVNKKVNQLTYKHKEDGESYIDTQISTEELKRRRAPINSIHDGIVL